MKDKNRFENENFYMFFFFRKANLNRDSTGADQLIAWNDTFAKARWQDRNERLCASERELNSFVVLICLSRFSEICHNAQKKAFTERILTRKSSLTSSSFSMSMCSAVVYANSSLAAFFVVSSLNCFFFAFYFSHNDRYC